MKARSFADVPAPWWHKLIAQHGDYPSLRALAKTSRVLHGLVTTHRPAFRPVHIALPADSESAQEAGAALLTLKPSDLGALSLDGTELVSLGQEDLTEESATSVLYNAVSSGAALSSIQTVELKNMMLESLVPTWLVPTYTNMKELRIHNLSPVPDDPTRSAPTIRPVCRSLERLVIANDTFEPDLSSLTPQLLHSLPSLRSIKLDFEWGSDNDSWETDGNILLQTLATIGPQLLDLCVAAQVCSLPPELPTWFPNLHTLSLPSLVALDSDVTVLLNMDSLRDLTCCVFLLEEDYSYRACPWTSHGQ